MAVLLATAVAALVAGAAAGLVVARWPSASPVAPELSPQTVAHDVERHRRGAAFLRRRLDATTAAGLALTVAAAVVVAGAVIVGVLAIMVREHTGFARWDRAVAEWGARHASDTSTSFLRGLTWFGSTAGVVTLAVVVGLVELRRRPGWAPVAFLALVVAGQSALSNTVKALVGRARPTFGPLTGFSGHAFPSGHATAGAATFAALALLASRARSVRAQAWIAGAAAALATSIAASRVLLGAHWLTDVVAGLALGWSWFALCSIAFGGRLLHFGAPAEVAERVSEVLDPGSQGDAPTG